MFKKGYKPTEEHKRKIGLANSKPNPKLLGNTHGFKKGHRLNVGEKAGNWKGDKVSYSALHKWIRYNYGEPIACEHCSTTDISKVYDWANKDHQYKRFREDWLRLCRKCHCLYDKQNKLGAWKS